MVVVVCPGETYHVTISKGKIFEWMLIAFHNVSDEFLSKKKNDETLKGLALELHQKHQEKVHFLGLLTHIFET